MLTCKFSLFFVEELGRPQVCGQKSPGNDREDNGKQALEDEDPSPSREAAYAVHLLNRGSQQAYELCSRGVAGMQGRNAPPKAPDKDADA